MVSFIHFQKQPRFWQIWQRNVFIFDSGKTSGDEFSFSKEEAMEAKYSFSKESRQLAAQYSFTKEQRQLAAKYVFIFERGDAGGGGSTFDAVKAGGSGSFLMGQRHVPAGLFSRVEVQMITNN